MRIVRTTNKETGKRGRDLAVLEHGELKGFRSQLGLSIKDMAEKLGISSRTLEALEGGSRETRTTIARLAWYMVKYQETKSRISQSTPAKRMLAEEEERSMRHYKAWEEGEI